MRTRLTVELSPESPAITEVPLFLDRDYQWLRVKLSGPGGIDLGVRDAGGARGWSGACRDHFELGIYGATPGYQPGPIEAGNWSILLGRYQVEQPTTVTLEIEAEAFEPGWLPGDLHCHTHHSDGKSTVAEVLQQAANNGLRFLAVTDHNTTTHHRYLQHPRVIPIPGQEVTTYGGHFNVLGCTQPVDFRFDDAAGALRALREAAGMGGFRVMNHPKPTNWDWSYGHWEEFDAIEVWNLPWATRNWVALERWHQALCNGLRVPAVGGSDRHQPPLPDPDMALLQLGSPTTWVEVREPGPAGVLAALRAGRSYISELPSGPHLRWRGRGALQVLGAKGAWLGLYSEQGLLQEQRVLGREMEISVDLKGRFLRAELYRKPGEDAHYEALVRSFPELPFGLTPEEILSRKRMLALNNPIYSDQ